MRLGGSVFLLRHFDYAQCDATLRTSHFDRLSTPPGGKHLYKLYRRRCPERSRGRARPYREKSYTPRESLQPMESPYIPVLNFLRTGSTRGQAPTGISYKQKRTGYNPSLHSFKKTISPPLPSLEAGSSRGTGFPFSIMPPGSLSLTTEHREHTEKEKKFKIPRIPCAQWLFPPFIIQHSKFIISQTFNISPPPFTIQIPPSHLTDLLGLPFIKPLL